MSTNQLKINLLEEDKKENDQEIINLSNKINSNLYNIENAEFQVSEYQTMNSEYEERIKMLKANNLLLDTMINDYTIPDYASEEQVDED